MDVGFLLLFSHFQTNENRKLIAKKQTDAASTCAIPSTESIALAATLYTVAAKTVIVRQ